MKPEDEVVNLVSGHPGGDPDDPSDDDDDEDGDDDRGGRGCLPHGNEDAGLPQGGVVPLVRDGKYLLKLPKKKLPLLQEDQRLLDFYITFKCQLIKWGVNERISDQASYLAPS